MEIISYVGFNRPANQNLKKTVMASSLHSSEKIVKHKYSLKKSKPQTLVAIPKPKLGAAVATPKPKVKAAVVAPKPKLKAAAVQFSAAYSEKPKQGNFMAQHTWLLLSAIFSIFTVYAGRQLAGYFESYTGPVNFHANTGVSEIERLNEIMSKFAFEAGPAFSENGSLLDADGNEIALAENLFKTAVTYQNYTVQSGDTISDIMKKFGLSNLSTIIGINNISDATRLFVGKTLKIPSTDGLIYKVQEGNTLESLSVKHKVTVEDLLDVNDLQSQSLTVGQEIFIPGARLSTDELSQALGTYFAKPITAAYRITSRFGWRNDPISGQRSHHTGIDLACPKGTPVKAMQGGTVAFVGYSNVFGNYVILNHGNGYQSLYAHFSVSTVKRGQRVPQGGQVGLVGSTGYSTGNHLHFTVYKNGKLIDPESIVKF